MPPAGGGNPVLGQQCRGLRPWRSRALPGGLD
jgi:hypothetical protein